MVSRRNVRRRSERRRRPFGLELRYVETNTTGLASVLLRPRPDRRLMLSTVTLVRTTGQGREIIGPYMYEVFFADDAMATPLTMAVAGDDNAVGLIVSGAIFAHDELRWQGRDRPIGGRGMYLAGRWAGGDFFAISSVGQVLIQYEEIH